MAEGFSRTPDQPEASQPAKAPEAGRFSRSFKKFFSIERPPDAELEDKKDKKESVDDDTETSKDKKGRFTRAWRLLFPKVAQKESVDGAKPVRSSLFFERSDILAESDDSTNKSTAETSQDSLHQSVSDESLLNSVTAQTEASSATSEAQSEIATENPLRTATVEAGVAAPLVHTEAAPSTPTNERIRTVVYDRVPDEVDALPVSERAPTHPANVIERSAAPERVVASLTTTERMRQARIERRQKEIKRELEHTNNELKKQSDERVVEQNNTVQKQTVVERQPLPQQRNVESRPSVDKVINKTETVEKTTLKTVEQAPEKQHHPDQKRVAEQLLNTEIKEVTEDSKEINYELSHEHKDMDNQTAAAWAALQASADEQAKANAAAIAAAQQVTQQQAQDEAKKLATLRQQTMYKQAVSGGFIAAVVIIVIIIVMFLLK